MSIFGFGKKKEEQKQSCCCGGNCTPETMQVAEAEKKESGIKILGGGCAKCNALEAATEEALRELGMDATIDHVRDFEKIAAYGVMTTVGTVISSSLVAYGFSRCKFKGRGLLFAAMLVSMMLPAQVLMIPQYLWYQKLGWVGTYLPLIVPYFFAIQGFFVYLILNFIDGIPKDLDEAARIDGCSYFGIYLRIILPLIVPALITAGIFSFMWRWDDFLSALLYVKESVRYPASLALKLFCDPGSSSDYGAMFAMSTLSIIPAVTIFIVFQKYLVEGIATSGLKG